MLGSRVGLSPVMVGRDAELAELRGHLAALRPGDRQPPVVVVSGEAGVGKTRLLRELGDEVRQAGGAVLAGRAEETSVAPSFALLRDALEGVVSAWDGVPEALAVRDHAVRHVLSPLLPEHHPSDDHEHTRDELLRGAVDVVVHVLAAECGPAGGARAPALLVFEDLHWADAESVALFCRLAATPDLPALLVGTFRPEEFDRRHPLAQALPALERQRSVSHLTLGRLDELALGRMLEAAYAAPVPAAAVAALHRRTQGNPFFVEELVAGCDDPARLAGAPLPWNAAEAVLRRVDELAPETRRVLAAASLLGSRVPFDLLAGVLGTDEDELIARLRVLVERGLLVETDPDVFAFRHALTREAVAGQMLGREQQRIHQAALELLEAQGSDDVLGLAHRAAGARQWAKLVRYGRAGAVRLLHEGSALQALQLAELALGKADTVAGDDELALHAVAARAAWLTGFVDVALGHTGQWRLLAVEEKSRAEEAAALRHESLLRWHVGDRARYWAAVQQAREVAEGLGASAELAWCYAFESQAHLLDGDAADAIAWADRALDMADAVAAPEVRGWALVNKGLLLAERPGQESTGLRLLEAAADEALERGDVMTTLRALNNALVHREMHAGAAAGQDARGLLARMRAVAHRFGVEVFVGKIALHEFSLACIEGDLAAAEAAIDRSVVPLGDPLRSTLVAARAFLAGERGDVGLGHRLLETSGLPDRQDESVLRWESARLWLAVRARDGAAAELALARLEEACAAGEWFLGREQVVCEAVLAGLAARLDRARLGSLLEQTANGGAGARLLFEPGWITHGRAALAAQAGDHEAAAAGYREALDGLRLARPAWVTADAHAGLARSLAALGRRTEARDAAQEALRALERWPGWRRDQAIALDRRVAGARSGQPGALTPRELEVLALIAEGLSNRDIAARLYIATKTVAVHVSNILAKTGATSRTEAATWALRSGVLERP